MYLIQLQQRICFAFIPVLRAKSLVIWPLALVVLALVTAASPAAHAATYSWQSASGDWSLASNWGGTVPAITDYAYVANGGTTAVTHVSETSGTLSIGTAAGTGNVQMTGGALSGNYAFVGSSGTGSFTQSAGTNSTIHLYIGSDTGSNGSYSLSGSGLILSGGGILEYVGYSGTGTFNQTGGRNLFDALYLSYNTSGNGSYALSAGTLNVTNEYNGYSGTASLTQTGGSSTVTGFYLGYNPGSLGNYSLSGSGYLLNLVGTQYVGFSGIGNFTQSGGINTGNSDLYLACNAASSGAYNLGGGLLSPPSEFVGYSSTGSFTESGGTNSALNAIYLGYNSGSSGTYYLSGGTARVLTGSQGVYLGYGAGSSGAFYLSGSGYFSASFNYVGNSGTGNFNQSGGTNIVFNSLYVGYNVGSSGVYTLSGGSLFGGNEYVGNSGPGSFVQTGGTNNTVLNLGYNSGSGGTYNLSGSGYLTGALGSTEIVGVSGSGNFTQTGGTNSTPGVLYLGYNTGSRGTYSLSDSGYLAVHGNANSEYVGYSGTGSFTQTGGTNTANGFLYVANNAGSVGTYTLGGSGYLSTLNIYVGQSGVGNFVQSGGTNSTADVNVSGSGVFSLGGSGYLSALGENITQSGTFSQTGGTNLVGSDYLNIGNQGNGVFSISGGYLSSAVERVQAGIITQSGGSNSVSNVLHVDPINTNFSSVYTLSGSGYLSANMEEIGDIYFGSFTQSGGTNSAGALYLGYGTNFGLVPSGTYSLSNGYLTAGTEEIGYFGKGLFTQTGGTNNAGLLNVGGWANSGTYTLAGGLLTAGSVAALAGTSTFNFNGGTLQASGNNTDFFSGITAAKIQAGGATVDVLGFNDTISQNLLHDPALGATHDGGLKMLGAGVLTLAGSNTYNGPTTVSQGELVVNGSLVSPVTVNNGGALRGTGSLSTVTVNSGGHLAPGDAPGLLTLSGSLSLLSGAKMDYELDTPLDSDEIYMPTSLLSLHGQQFSDFNFTALGGFGPGSYTLIDAGSISGSLGGNTGGTINGLPATLAIQGNDVVLTVVVPEPGTLALLAASSFAYVSGLCRRERKRLPARR
jgi:hypothetical protein